jgi:hypothetical protein
VLSRRSIIYGLLIFLSGVVALRWGMKRITPSGAPPPSADVMTSAVPAGGDRGSPAAWSQIVETLMAAPTQAAARQTLGLLKRQLLAADQALAFGWIRKQLAKKEEVLTGLEFTIGRDRSLSGWPTFRVFLLDLVREIDAVAAATLAREILQVSNSADEWAVALRNLALEASSNDDRDWLKAKTVELLRNEAWRGHPSVGYLEAFDLFVFTQNTEVIPELVSMTENHAQPGVRHAAYLTLDRLVLVRPEPALKLLVNTASMHPGSGRMISNMVARADVRDQAQLQLVERYLLDGRRSTVELQSFCNVFPNANFSVSNNLLTEKPTFEGADMALRDRQSLMIVTAWMEDPRFARLHPMLRTTFLRLRSFTGGP